MKNQNILSEEDAQKLFQSAKEFNEIKPWRWLGDTDVFGVKFHDIEEIVFCSVLGSGEQVYGMVLYIGVEGIDSYFKLIDEAYDFPQEAIHLQKALTIYFDDRKDIEKPDYEFIKFSGVSFRGKKAWPNFRKYEPGFVPWILNKEELILMGRVLNVAKDRTLYLKENPQKAELLQLGQCCIFEVGTDGKYKEDLLKYEEFFDAAENDIEIPVVFNELMIKRITKECQKSKKVWEIDSFYHMMPVGDEDVPFFPALLLIVEKETELIVGNHMTHPYLMAEEWQQYIIQLLMTEKILPEKVVVSNPQLLINISALFEELDVEIVPVENLDIIPKIKEDFFSMEEDV